MVNHNQPDMHKKRLTSNVVLVTHFFFRTWKIIIMIFSYLLLHPLTHIQHINFKQKKKTRSKKINVWNYSSRTLTAKRHQHKISWMANVAHTRVHYSRCCVCCIDKRKKVAVIIIFLLFSYGLVTHVLLLQRRCSKVSPVAKNMIFKNTLKISKLHWNMQLLFFYP